MPSRRDHYEFLYGRRPVPLGPQRPPPPAERESNFPWFEDGNTLVIIKGSRQLKLHSTIISSSSSVLRRLLQGEGATKLSKAAIKKGVTITYRIVLRRSNDEEDIDGQEEEAGPIVFDSVALDDMGQPLSGEHVPLDLENGLIIPACYHNIEQVFAAMYNKQIELGNADEEGIGPIITKAYGIQGVAKDLDCVEIVAKPIEAALLACGQVLWRSIAENPTSWLHFAYTIKSRPLFRESIIHATGKFNSEPVQAFIHNHSADDPVVKLLRAKGSALLASSQEVQMKITSHYPNQLQREKTIGRADKDSIGRDSYANDIYFWIALACYRQLGTQVAIEDLSHHGEDMGFEYFKCVANGGNQYLTREAINEFNILFPMSVKGSSVLEGKINEIKQNVMPFAQPLMRNNSELDIARFPVQHMTCAQVTPEEFPWMATAGDHQNVEEETEAEDQAYSDMEMS